MNTNHTSLSSRPFELPKDILEPQALWSYFYTLCRIPRGSGNTEAVQRWLLDFAAAHGLESRQDKVGNVLIRKPASPNKQAAAPVVLQAHMDMVCEKNADTVHDFKTDPIQPVIDGEWLKANGTTLGADNGIGMAAQLAVLADTTLEHGPVECLFTVDEETGLSGAFGLEPGFFEGRTLINLDSEDDGELFIGCAGGMNSHIMFHFETEPVHDTLFFFTLQVKGLQGGHSGDDIEKGRGNANHLLARTLWQLSREVDLRLAAFTGGNLSNAIPREASCLAAVPSSQKETVRVQLNYLLADLEDEYRLTDPKLAIELSSTTPPAVMLTKTDSDRFIQAMYACPTGVMAMSFALPGLVETSLNLASVKPVDATNWLITTSQRSSVESAKHALSQRLEAFFTLADMRISHTEGYPGWKPNPDSALVNLVATTHKDLFGKDPHIRAIHAGLECGLFLLKYPHLDMVSFGPTMRGVHSPDERLHIPTVQPFWALLTETLKRL
jgi:dipeptidase D